MPAGDSRQANIPGAGNRAARAADTPVAAAAAAAGRASRPVVAAGRRVVGSPADAPDVDAHQPILSARGVFLNVLRSSTGSVCPMAELKDRLRSDLTEAMKSQEKLRTATLRMLLAAIQTEEVSGKAARELTDEDVSA